MLDRLYTYKLVALVMLGWRPEELQGLKGRIWLLLGSLNRTLEEVSRMAVLVDRVLSTALHPLMGEGHNATLTNPALLARVAECWLTDL